MSKKSIIRTRVLKKPRKTASETYLVNKKYLGEEPTAKDLKTMSRAVAYNWYNQMCDAEEARSFLADWLNSNGRQSDAKKLKRLPDSYLPLTVCWIARMATNGVPISDETWRFFNTKLSERWNHLDAEKAEQKEVQADRPTIQDRINDKVTDYIGKVENALDEMFQFKGDCEFSLYDLMQKDQFPAKFASRIAEYYKPHLDEMKLVVKGKDADLNEGYKHLNAKQKKAYCEFYQMLIDDAQRYGSNMKKIRKPRKARVQSVEKKLKYFKYKAEDSALKIASCKPQDLLGAQEVWLYNTSVKQLTVLRAIDRGGLDVKRSSIVNYDEKTSVTKRAGRNLEQTLKTVVEGGKVALRKLMDDISSQKIDCADRVTSNTVILRVVK